MPTDGGIEDRDGLYISIQHEDAPASPTLPVAAVASQLQVSPPATIHSPLPPATQPAASPSPAGHFLAPSSQPPADSATCGVWSANKAMFLICKYKELKEKIGISGGFK
ncbi:hypothetical protein HPB48_022553 [Haemaphysalis longicornis]|uniref:Uncharacterized protein n=1 Tax=Haemaphysalis longicornis TaxID=44386 RepID=A0A9J6G035_HAELO|nr:hypothetical protein HPB48_022553 [Haemaphysalis longicornis]